MEEPRTDLQVDYPHLVKSAVVDIYNEKINLGAGPGLQRSLALIKEVHREGSALSRLCRQIERDPAFGDLRNGWLQTTSSGHAVAAHGIAVRWVNAVLENEPIDQIIESTHQFAADPTSGFETVVAVAGIGIEQPIPVADNIDLMPWDDVPASDVKRRFSDGTADLVTHGDTGPIRPFFLKPTLAIRFRHLPRRCLFPGPGPGPLSEEQAQDDRNASLEFGGLLDDALSALTLHTACPLVVMGYWEQPTHEVAKGMVGNSYAYTTSQSAHAQNVLRLPTTKFEDVSVQATFADLRAFLPSELKVLRIALERFREAVCRARTVEKAIDLGITFEVVLLHEQRNLRDRGELRYRMSLRGAAFLGGTKEARGVTFRLLKRAYDLRSAAVHGGTLEGEADAEATLTAATKTCADILRKLVSNRAFPDWDQDFVIGSDSVNGGEWIQR